MPADNQPYALVGTPVSLYSGKMRSYLRHKRIPYFERDTNPWELQVTFARKLNAVAVPVVVTPQGEYLGDTSCIIDELETRFPESPVLPSSPILRTAAYLFELWGDEFWLPLAMHTRWSHRDENIGQFLQDVGDFILGGFPGWMKNAVGRHFANQMNGYVPVLGISDETQSLLDRFLVIHLDGLDTHFQHYRFLFGDRPSLGDFGMMGPLYAHIGRDPWSKRELIEPRPHLKAWIERMNDAHSSTGGDFLPDDAVPETLQPAIRSIFDEMVPFIQGCAEAVWALPAAPENRRKALRFARTTRYPFAGAMHERNVLTYVVWMAQRLLEAVSAMTRDDQLAVRAWLASVGGESLLDLELPRVVRVGLAANRVAGSGASLGRFMPAECSGSHGRGFPDRISA